MEWSGLEEETNEERSNSFKRQRSKTEESIDDEYFKSYDDLSVHELMLKDEPRTNAYLRGIEDNKQEFEGKVVLDVGTGTGILALFAARAGAKKVYAVEASDMATIAATLIRDNGYEDTIEVFKERMEDIELPEKVDIIVSEWMGFFLFHESMLDSVIAARDRWLKPGGFVWPNKARLYLCPVSMDKFFEEKFGYWKNVYGFNFSSLISLIKEKALQQPQIQVVESLQLISNPILIKEIDLHTCVKEELRFIQFEFDFKATRSGSLHGFCSFFEVLFEGNTPEETILLSTAPGQPETHWKQTVFMLPEEFQVEEGSSMPGVITMVTDSENQRHYNVSIEMGTKETEEQHSPSCDCVKCQIVKALEFQL